jgi:hypothetical protein
MPTPNPQDDYGPTTGGGDVVIDVLPPGREQIVVLAELAILKGRSSDDCQRNPMPMR